MFLLASNVSIGTIFCFPWKQVQFLCLQIRIDGRVEKLSEAESNAYFRSRPLDSQISGAISQQSQPISSREVSLFFHTFERLSIW